MMSVHSSSLDGEEVDLSGLVESVVDSDEEDLAESIDVSSIIQNKKDILIVMEHLKSKKNMKWNHNPWLNSFFI